MSTTQKARNPQTRLNININMRTAHALKEYAADNGISITESVRRLIGIGNFIAQAINDGAEVQLKRGRDIDKVVFDL